ncbi:MAG: ATP-binding protein, partial [Candidatus Odinarchaeota archaeon]
KSLYEKNFITYESRNGTWELKLDKIRYGELTGNVVDLMASRILKLTESSQDTLKYAACVGVHFDLALLSLMLNKSNSKVIHDLWEALKEGLIIPLSDTYKFVQYLDNPIVQFRFLHERVQKAAYSMIGSDKKKEMHLKIGRLLLINSNEKEREERSFDIVNQLNLGIDLIKERLERNELARLNLKAGKEAKDSSAYQLAYEYLKTGISLLDEESWRRQYDLSLSLYVEAAEAAYFNCDFIEMNHLIDVVLEQARNAVDKVKTFEIRIQAHVSRNELRQAIEIGLQVLNLLGVNFPQQPGRSDILSDLLNTRLIYVSRKNIEQLADLPEMKDLNKIATMRILSSLIFSTYVVSPRLFILMVSEQIRITLKHGNAPCSAFAYACYGLILSGFMENLKAGEKFGNLALNVLNRFDASELVAKTFLVVYDFIKHRNSHVRETLQPLMEAYHIGMETGDFEYASLNAHVYCYHSYICGIELTELVQVMSSVNKTIKNLGQNASLNLNLTYHQAVLKLINPDSKPTELTGEVFSKEKMLPFFLKTNETTAIFNVYFHQLILCYLFQEFEGAVKNANMAEKYLKGTTGTIGFLLFHFYDSLARLAVYESVTKEEQKYVDTRLEKNQRILKKWADSAPMNHMHKFYLVAAEIARIKGKTLEAMNLYDQSIELAREHKYIQDEALANELAARFYIAVDKEKIAKMYLLESKSLYERWGAVNKVQNLENSYSKLFSRRKRLSREEMENWMVTTTSTTESMLDLSTVIKASQAVSREIHLANLLEKMMSIVIENAGAQKGYFITANSGELTIEAKASIDKEPMISVKKTISLEKIEESSIALMVVNYTLRMRETVVLDDVCNSGMFNRDPYISKNKPKSILCMPFLYQGKLSGILYLENNLITGAFTPERLQLLEVLSSQIAISLENARLYHQLEEYSNNLERKVDERTQELLQKNEELLNINNEKNEILHIVSHDLKNPLTVIKGYAELIQMQDPDQTLQDPDLQKIVHYSNKIVDNTQRMFSMIMNLLDVDAIYYGKISIWPEKLDLSKLLTIILDQYEEQGRSRNIIIGYENTATSSAILADRKATTQIIGNLLSNAVKFSPPDKRVQIRITDTENTVRCEVQDEGPGISEEDQRKLFRKYTTLSAKPANGFTSTGLGLSIAKKLVDLMKGRIWCESELGIGSKFVVEFRKAK